MAHPTRSCVVLFLLWTLSCGSSAERLPPRKIEAPSAFSMTRSMVPMRDGVALETVVFAPRDTTQPLPILLTRTPYGVPTDASVLDGTWYRRLRADGYIFASQSLRGRFGSEGTFVMDRPPRDRSGSGSRDEVDETSDAYDSIAWLVEHVPNNNGRVGMVGGSYAAWTATLALLEPHPALKVVSAAGSPADQFIGDDLHHNGALRLSYAFEFSVFLDSSKRQNTAFQFDRDDRWHRRRTRAACTLARVLRTSHGRIRRFVRARRRNLDELAAAVVACGAQLAYSRDQLASSRFAASRRTR